jgi:hypothetical protein
VVEYGWGVRSPAVGLPREESEEDNNGFP